MGINKGADEINNKEEKRGKEAAFKTSAKEDEAGRKKKAKNPGSSSSRLTGIPGLVLLFSGFLLSYYVGARETGVFFLLFFCSVLLLPAGAAEYAAVFVWRQTHLPGPVMPGRYFH